MADWYYAIDDQEHGPISSQELKELAAAGELKPGDQVWREGMANWVQAGSIKNLCPLAPLPKAAPLPKIEVQNTPRLEKAAPAAEASTLPKTEAPEWKPAIEHKLAPVAGEEDEDSLDVEPPVERPSEEVIAPQMAAIMKEEMAKVKAASKEKDYMDHAEAFELGEQAKKVAAGASRDALEAFKNMVKNPVGGLPLAFEQLGPTRALAVGVVFAVVFSACFFVSVHLFKARVMGRDWLGIDDPTGFVAFLKIGVLSLIAPLGVLAGCAASRAMFKGQGGFPSDVFIGGTALLPLAVFALIDGLLGAGNNASAPIIYIGLLFAFTTTVLILYSGSTRLHQTPEAAATIAVPIMMLLCLWIPRIVSGILFG